MRTSTESKAAIGREEAEAGANAAATTTGGATAAARKSATTATTITSGAVGIGRAGDAPIPHFHSRKQSRSSKSMNIGRRGSNISNDGICRRSRK